MASKVGVAAQIRKAKQEVEEWPVWMTASFRSDLSKSEDERAQIDKRSPGSKDSRLSEDYSE
jgi:hypothetical protein